MKAHEKTTAIRQRLERVGIVLEQGDVSTLRRAAITLDAWATRCCGSSDGRAIERDEVTGKPFATWDMGQSGKRGRAAIADREAGALRRVEAICKAHGLYYYHQSDPRGAPLYVSREPLTDINYDRGVCIWVD